MECRVESSQTDTQEPYRKRGLRNASGWGAVSKGEKNQEIKVEKHETE